MAKRRRAKVVWLPNTNANSVGISQTATTQIALIDFVGPGDAGDFISGEIPVVIDGEQAPLDPATSLSDIFNSGYRIRRIVGKIWCTQRQEAFGAGAGSNKCLFHAGLIVRRAEELGTSYAFASDPTGGQIGPGEIQNASDPWIWRRAWSLSNDLAASSEVFPALTHNGFAGSVSDGPHVDVKTARIVSQEERLFLNFQLTLLASQDQGGLCQVLLVADLRVLATIQSSVGNRGNNSR